MSPFDYRYTKLIGSDPFALDREGTTGQEFEEYSEQFEGHRLNGYPLFAQTDPRKDLNSAEEPYEFLLQIDSEDNKIDTLWRDSGVCNFFIKPSALAKLDFSDVLYNWDCG